MSRPSSSKQHPSPNPLPEAERGSRKSFPLSASGRGLGGGVGETNSVGLASVGADAIVRDLPGTRSHVCVGIVRLSVPEGVRPARRVRTALPSGVVGMSRHLPIVARALALAVSIGCATDRPVHAPAVSQDPIPTRDVSKPPSVARPQKEDSGGVVRTGLDDTLPEASSEVTNAQSAARILATVNAAPVFYEEVQALSFQFLALVDRLPEPDRSIKRREILKEALDQLVERELIIQDAFNRLQKAGKNTLDRLKDGANKEFDKRWVSTIKKGNHLKSDEELQELLRKSGLSLETIRRHWTRQAMATEYLRSRIMPYTDKISREEMLEYYEKHPEEFKIDDAVEWQDIFISANTPRQPNRDRVAAHKLAEQLAARAKTG